VALAAVERAWWPLQLAALMAVIGVALDVLVYDRVLEYQPGWLALPLGALELGLVILAARLLGIDAPLAPAVALFAAGWLAAQVLGHAVLPLARLTYAQDGGELGRAARPSPPRWSHCSRGRREPLTPCARLSCISRPAYTKARS
jgi:hypothetical protein